MALPLSTISKLLIIIIRTYQLFISPLLGPHCRFSPTCSQYGIESILRFGILKGSWLILKRILKCHPLNNSEYRSCTHTSSKKFYREH